MQWHPTKNAPLSPREVSPFSNKKAWWICEKGHEWQARINSCYSGCGCPFCAGKKVLPGKNDLLTLRPDLALQWHKKRNTQLDPTQLSPYSNKKAWWVCEKKHEWQAAICSRSKGHGCPYCSGRIATEENNLAVVAPKLSSQWHPSKNGNLLPSHFKAGSSKKVWWQCEKGHEWAAVIASRNNGVGCPYCSGRKVQKGFNDLKTKRPDIALEWDYLKNDITPEDVTSSSNKKVWWKCSVCGREWESKINNRTSSLHTGCPYCAKELNKQSRSA